MLLLVHTHHMSDMLFCSNYFLQCSSLGGFDRNKILPLISESSGCCPTTGTVPAPREGTNIHIPGFVSCVCERFQLLWPWNCWCSSFLQPRKEKREQSWEQGGCRVWALQVVSGGDILVTSQCFQTELSLWSLRKCLLKCLLIIVILKKMSSEIPSHLKANKWMWSLAIRLSDKYLEPLQWCRIWEIFVLLSSSRVQGSTFCDQTCGLILVQAGISSPEASGCVSVHTAHVDLQHQASPCGSTAGVKQDRNCPQRSRHSYNFLMSFVAVTVWKTFLLFIISSLTIHSSVQIVSVQTLHFLALYHS